MKLLPFCGLMVIWGLVLVGVDGIQRRRNPRSPRASLYVGCVFIATALVIFIGGLIR